MKITHKEEKKDIQFIRAKTKYGITKEEYDSLIRKCQICGSEDNLVIDHSHQPKMKKYMLCRSCSKGLTCFKNDATSLEKAIEYILKNDKINDLEEI